MTEIMTQNKVAEAPKCLCRAEMKFGFDNKVVALYECPICEMVCLIKKENPKERVYYAPIEKQN